MLPFICLELLSERSKNKTHQTNVPPKQTQYKPTVSYYSHYTTTMHHHHQTDETARSRPGFDWPIFFAFFESN